jgi:GNAT superfamily N-acetyltransferase
LINQSLFTRPSALLLEHDVSDFFSGEDVLDEWLRKRALSNQKIGASKTYVTCAGNTQRVAGYYALSMGQILNHDVPGSMRRNMPVAIPAVTLGRLAVDKTWQGHRLGQGLLQDAIGRAVKASKDVSARLLIVHAISKQAEGFYEHHGFTRLALETPTFALDLINFQNQQSTGNV